MGLELRFLGGVQILRDGRSMALPPSKKTRALLAYLVLNQRQFSREHLCELLWEIPDDPRGSLRWSLSKLRRLVDEIDRPHIIADRGSVEFDSSGVTVDVQALDALATTPLSDLSTAALEQACQQYHGHFLEGLELSNFHTFHAWCVNQRETVIRSKSQLLAALIDKLADQPELALPYARQLVSVSPYGEAARANLIKMLVASGAQQEAEQQYQLGVRLLKEIGQDASPLLLQAWRGMPGQKTTRRTPPATVNMRVSAANTVLIGREEELDAIRNALAHVVDNRQARVVLLQGPPGMGKSRLLEFARDASVEAGARTLVARSFESETIRPFALWTDAIRQIDQKTSDEVFSNLELENRDSLFDRLGAVVSNAAGTEPLGIFFDDLQWCDESSAAALHVVIRQNQARPVFVVLAARSEELRDNTPVQKLLRSLRRDALLLELKLAPLNQEAVQQLIELHAPDIDSASLSGKCGGNPLLTVELARAEASGEPGASLDELIRERLAGFDLDSAEILQWASALAPRIDLEILVAITRLDSAAVNTALESAEQQGIVSQTTQGYQFTHDLVAQSVYADISPARRKIMHRTIAEWLAGNAGVDLDRAADLSHHASQSGDAALAARALVQAGKLCLRFFANEEALGLAHKGLTWAEDLPAAERVKVEIELEDVLLTAAPLADWESAALRYVDLAERALDFGALAHARLGYQMASYVRWLHGNWTGAREQSLQAERVTRGAKEEDHLVGMAETARCLALIERDLSQADAMLMEAQALAKRKSFGHHSIAIGLGILRYHENELEKSREFFLEARTLCRTSGDRISEFESLEYLAMIDIENGDFTAAKRTCKALIELASNIREGSEAPYAAALNCLCQYAIEDDDTELEAALTELRIADAKHRMAYLLIRCAFIDLERDRTEQAIKRAKEALAYAELLERASEITMARIVLAVAYHKNDDKAYQEQTAAIRKLREQPIAAWIEPRLSILLPELVHD